MSNTMPGNFRKTWKNHDVETDFAWIVLIGPVANLLCIFYTFRHVTILGGIMLGLGYFLSGFVTRMEYIYLTFLCTGIGYGLTFAPFSTIVSYNFDKHRALANDITVSGSGVGTIVLPFLYKYLIEQYGLQGAFWILGAIFSNLCVAACVLRQPRFLIEKQTEKVRICRSVSNEYNAGVDRLSSETSVEESVKTFDKRPCGALDLRFYLLKNVSFTLYVISFMFCEFGVAGSHILIPASVKSLGDDRTYVALSVTILGGVEVVARILMGWFADLKVIKRKYIYVISMLICGAFSLLAPLFESFSFISVYAAITAAFPGSFFSLISVLTIDAVGLEHFSSAFGLLSLSFAVAVIPSQPSIGWLYDLTGTWDSSFILIGCMYSLAGVIVLLEPIVVRCCSRPDIKETCSLNNLQQSNNQDRPTVSACTDDVCTSDTRLTS